eukprot:augustus_masked-scaffold_57-processed-gene-0.56-mRNA-1 protein AED:1.00 eAED:1.00 QI:0/-1/0/0/-1/1/1/0/138
MINLLQGEECHEIWKWRIESLLHEKEKMVDLESQISKLKDNKDPLVRVSTANKNTVLVSLIINRISDKVLMRLKGVKSAAAEIWTKLAKMFSLTDRAQKQIAKDKFKKQAGNNLSEELQDFKINITAHKRAGAMIDNK